MDLLLFPEVPFIKRTLACWSLTRAFVLDLSLVETKHILCVCGVCSLFRTVRMLMPKIIHDTPTDKCMLFFNNMASVDFSTCDWGVGYEDAYRGMSRSIE